MAVQQRRTSKSRRDKRRATHTLTSPVITSCSNCSKIIRPHRVCKCGFYKNQKVLNLK